MPLQPMSYASALKHLRYMISLPWKKSRPYFDELSRLNFTVHSLKTTMLSWFGQLPGVDAMVCGLVHFCFAVWKVCPKMLLFCCSNTSSIFSFMPSQLACSCMGADQSASLASLDPFWLKQCSEMLLAFDFVPR